MYSYSNREIQMINATAAHQELVASIIRDAGYHVQIMGHRIIVKLSRQSVSSMQLRMIDDLADMEDEGLIQISSLNGIGRVVVNA
jgi:hypothetical protein